MASGKDVSDMFPGVVKNVVSKNIEVRSVPEKFVIKLLQQQNNLLMQTKNQIMINS